MFKYINDELILEQGQKQVPVSDIVKEHQQAFYLYDIDGIKDWYQLFIDEIGDVLKVFFAMKCNNNPQVLKALQEMGSGVDIVSGGEAKAALNAGFTPDQIVFSGVAKTEEELEMAISKDFFQINVESFEELQEIVKIAKRLKKQATIALRLNPDVAVDTHPHISTGLKDHKFGLAISELDSILDFIKNNSKHLVLQGLSMHIGSQIFDLSPMYEAIKNMKNIYENLQNEHPSLKTLDIGGGLGFYYDKEGLEAEKKLLKDFSLFLKDTFKDFKGSVLAEPGRFLVAPFGILCAKIEYIKDSPSKSFIILNSGMNHFLRPALYSAKHRILSLKKDEKNQKKYDVVGPICETGDTFAKDYQLPKSLKKGDFLVISDVGAYGQVMANSYNLQPKAQEIGFLCGKKLKKTNNL